MSEAQYRRMKEPHLCWHNRPLSNCEWLTQLRGPSSLLSMLSVDYHDDTDEDVDYQPPRATTTARLQRPATRHSSTILLQEEPLTSSPAPSSAIKRKKTVQKSAHNKRHVSESKERWHCKEESDINPKPPPFTPARTPGPTFDTSAQWSPLALFQLFFSASVVRTIIDNTNANAEKKQAKAKSFRWKLLTVPEFYVFIAVVIFTGIVKVPDRDDYWTKRWPYNFSFPRNAMSRDRFEAILWSLHLSDPKDNDKKESRKGIRLHDRLFKIKPLYTDIVSACKANFQPQKNISINQRVVPSARITAKPQCTNGKASALGFKLLVLADSLTAYTWNFFVCSEKTVSSTIGQSLRDRTIMDIVDPSRLGGGYKLFVNNFYSSPTLFRDLQKFNIGCCGPIRKNQVGFPKTTENDLPAKAEKGDLRWLRKADLLFVKWMGPQKVTMCSSLHVACSGQTMKSKVKVNGGRQMKRITIPDAVQDYNRHKGGVDLSGDYTVHHKTIKWYKTFFFHFVEIAVVNAFILHKELIALQNEPTMQKPLTQQVFRERLAASMLELDGKTTAPPTPSPPPAAGAEASQVTCMPTFFQGNCRKYCRRCHAMGTTRVKTKVYCRKCEVPLCFTQKKNCFQLWHDEQH
ncbi:piggyBac transposable element-derived protein 4-like isoform X2 [Hippocampus comes]|uniref:piggyBac transposable element-derived protein 4-like isoform X2 n=2 Tax=Hippocampus comes TaxID=109280 RepID=UPI00094EE668|nr:PREDICTED: piggyBac transposable element-derived protein 4-like isoform X2 [Hippocampus comes]